MNCLLPQTLPWRTYKWVAYAGEGWEGLYSPHQHAHIPISDRHDPQIPTLATIRNNVTLIFLSYIISVIVPYCFDMLSKN